MAPVHTWLGLPWTRLRTPQTPPDLCRHTGSAGTAHLCHFPSPVPGDTLLLLGEASSMFAGPPPIHSRCGCPPGQRQQHKCGGRVPCRHTQSPREPSKALSTATGPFCASESSPPLKDTVSVSGQTPSRGFSVTSPSRSEELLSLQHQQTETGRSRHADAEDRVLPLAGCIHFSPSGCRVDSSEGLWPPRRGSALLAHLCSSEVMACLHRLNVRDQGLCQEDAKNL